MERNVKCYCGISFDRPDLYIAHLPQCTEVQGSIEVQEESKLKAADLRKEAERLFAHSVRNGGVNQSLATKNTRIRYSGG